MADKASIRARNVERCRERGIILPTFEMMRNPKALVPSKIQDELKEIGLWDLNSLNLFRICWYNDSETGGFRDVPNYIELPSEVTGVKARIVLAVGKFFPTGAHKVGATYTALAKGLTRGEFDPVNQKALWPSTGNFCRGGAYDSHLLGCEAIAVLPEEMSAERFAWLQSVNAEIHATPGCESNVKEVFDKTEELCRERGDAIIAFNQFEMFENPAWHYAVTGPALKHIYDHLAGAEDELAGAFFMTGSAGTISCSDYLRSSHPHMECGVGEALQCPTIIENGFGAHRIEGVGDKHIPWVYNSHTSNFAAALDDERVMRTFRLFNEPEGHKLLREKGVSEETIKQLALLGPSGIGNMLGCVKMAKHYDTMDEHSFLLSVATDSAEMYQSRLTELNAERGAYTYLQAALDYEFLMAETDAATEELGYAERKRVHNLKYYTWVEQRGKTLEEINAQWYDRQYWSSRFAMSESLEDDIRTFNEDVGVLAKYL